MWINIKTGYTFKQVYGHLDKIAERCRQLCEETGIKQPYGGIADLGNTFAHIPWQKACNKANIKPIYGVQLPVTVDLQREIRRYPYNWMTLIARTQSGLQEIYRLVDLSFQQFYYRQRITYDQINSTSDNVIILSGVACDPALLKKRVFFELSPCTPLAKRKQTDFHEVACCDNFYVDIDDDAVYEPFADERLRERKTSPIHILSQQEWLNIYPYKISAINNLKKIASMCNVDLPKAHMVKYVGKDNIIKWAHDGAYKKKIDVVSNGVYKDRFERELKLIIEKDYADYFLVVADAIRYAKTKMSVGPARGCFLPGQRVETFNGNSRKIETLKKGDRVKSAFGSTKKIIDVFEYEIEEEIFDIEFEDGTAISCTQDHKFLTIDGWKKACDLTSEDDICDVRTGNNKLSKLEQNGWDIISAHKYLKAGYIEYDQYLNNINFFPENSKIEVKLKCNICNEDSIVQIRKLTKRTNGLKNKPICNLCINKEARNTEEARQKNSKAQLIAQNKPSQIAKNSAAQIKRWGKDWCSAKYDQLFSDDLYHSYARFEHYEGKCQLCNGIGTDLHHIDGNKSSELDNIILLCKSCHTTYHNNKRYNDNWIEQKELMKKITRSML